MINIWCYLFKNKTLEAVKSDTLYPSADAFISSLPNGVYTTLRTVEKTKIFQLNFHLSRLRESLQLLNKNFIFSLNDIRKPLNNLVTSFPSDEVRIRLFIPLTEIEVCYLILEPLDKVDETSRINGVKVNTNTLNRVNPKAKMTSFIKKSKEIKQFCKEHNLEDSIMVNSQQDLLEGLSSNFFAVISGILHTADDEVLNGATREIILLEAKNENIRTELTPVNYSKIMIIDEAFISSTSRGIIPVVNIDDNEIGNGEPGRITKLLMHKIDSRLKLESEEII